MLAGPLGHERQMSIDYCKDRLKAALSEGRKEGRKKMVGVRKRVVSTLRLSLAFRFLFIDFFKKSQRLQKQ